MPIRVSPSSRSLCRSCSSTTRVMIRPTVLQATRISSATALLE
jgi:hypothetical protein